MIDLMPTDAKSKLREIRIVKAFIIFALVLSLLIFIHRVSKVWTYKLEICIYCQYMCDLRF